MKRVGCWLCAALGWALAALPAAAQTDRPAPGPTTNLFGSSGLVDMPGARPLPDGDIVVSFGNFAGMTRGQITAQFHPRLSGSFRYVGIENFNSAGFGTYYDRSFDLRFTLLEETATTPALTIGMQDFIGTGIYGAEYVALGKQVTPRLELTGGLGWGRLSGNRISGGFGTRPQLTPEDVAEGGEPNLDLLFRGDIGVFAGLQWRATDKLTLKAEYSGDEYDLEAGELDLFERRSPFNFGLDYQPSPGVQLGAYYLYGAELGLQLSFSLNPKRPPSGGSLDPAPPPVLPRPSRASAPEAYAGDWSQSRESRSAVRDRLAGALAQQGLRLEALDLTAGAARLYMRNEGYQATAQAIGRAARSMARELPVSIETFTIVPVRAGMALPAHSFRRTDIETLEVAPDGAERIRERRVVTGTPAAPEAEAYDADLYPRVRWRLSPYVRTSLFDPDDPLRADFGLALSAGLEVRPGLVFSGTARKRVVGNLDESRRPSNSVLPRVRSDFPIYDREADPGLLNLQAAYYFRPGPDLYGRVTVGYLETMFAGVSSELLWAPYDSRFALGAELNYVQQRDFDGGLGLRDYDVVSGHASLYYRFADDYFAQIDAGRYLAGDVGATLGLERVWANGWRVGAFATFTDVSADEFGEGSFDKGITLTIPLGWFVGQSTRAVAPLTIRPVQRDGGARLIVDGRLHDLVGDGRGYRVEEQWGRFWR